jgi:septal ring factor EnvC (AmiA/AmiB activator)
MFVWGQSKKDLEEKRRKIVHDIQTTERMLKKTAQTKDAAYDRFLALQSQIESRENLIQTLGEEITASDDAIARNKQVASFLNEDIQRMQEEYGRTLRSAYRRKSMSNPLLFILSAESLNQAFRRWLFLRKYDKFRKQQAEAIAFTRDVLTRRTKDLEEARIEKENLLVSMSGQQSTLSTESEQKNVLLKLLEHDEVRLKDDLNKKQQEFTALNNVIERVIAE